jgi:hypothetical protein
VNWDAESLGKAEAKLIREDFDLATMFIRSYRLMLNFYGMILVDEKTGKVARHPQIWRSRYANLLNHQHNFLRVNRILACLGHMGFHRWRKGFLAHLEKEIYDTEELKYCKMSFERFWKKNLEVNTQDFIRKTRELPEDRTESVYFKHLESNSETYQKYAARAKGEEEALMPLANEANQRDVQQHEQRTQRSREAQQRQIEKNKAEKDAKKKESSYAITQAAKSSNYVNPLGIHSFILRSSVFRKLLSKSTPNPASKSGSDSSKTSSQSSPKSSKKSSGAATGTSSSSASTTSASKSQEQANKGIPGWLRYEEDSGEEDVIQTSDDEKAKEESAKPSSSKKKSSSSSGNSSPSSSSGRSSKASKKHGSKKDDDAMEQD